MDVYLADLKKEIERAEREVKPSLLSSPYKEKVGVYIGLSEVCRKAIRRGETDMLKMAQDASI